MSQSTQTMSWYSDKLHRIVINNIYKLLTSLLFIIVLFMIIDETITIKSIAPFILFVFTLGFISERFHRNVAYEILINYKTSEISLSIYRTNEKIIINFNDINKIKANGYISIINDSRKIYLGVKVDKLLLESLSKIKRIQWGKFCFILGPSKNLINNQ